MANIKPTSLANVPSIRALEQKNGHTRFSFKHLDLTHPDFGILHREAKYFHAVFTRLKGLSLLAAEQLRGSRTTATRCHPISWDATSQPDGFKHLNAQLRDIDPYQMQVEQQEYGRMHGFFIDDVFFVVWLDPDHKLYPG